MNNNKSKTKIGGIIQRVVLALAACFLAANFAAAANTNAFDTGLNYYPTPNSMNGNNKGFGFGAWAMSGNSYIDNASGLHPHAFAIWNGTTSGISSAKRTFNSALEVGGTFSCDYMINNLFTGFTNGFQLQDAGGNVVFSYFHQGGDNANGHYTDANGTGLATGFAYNQGKWVTLTFSLDSATTYTFTGVVTNTAAPNSFITNTFSGTLSGAAITQVKFVRGNTFGVTYSGGGQDMKFDNLLITSITPVPPAFITGPATTWGFAGNTVGLGAIASSSQPVNYQWYFANAVIPGATSTNIVLANLGFTNTGNYFVVASNSLGSATSSVAVVTVLPSGFTNALDVAANYSTFTGNQGFGFGPWTLSTAGGGSLLSGGMFDIWNSAAAGQSTATRTFNAPLAVGGNFLVQLKLNTLEAANMQNGFQLQDSAGNVLFSFWHQGGDGPDGHYSDASGTGTATGFARDFAPNNFAFVLTSSTTYTFYELTTGASLSGTLSGADISKVAFVRANLVEATTTGGQDLQFNTLVIMGPNGIPPVFIRQPVSSGGLVGSTVSLGAEAVSSQAVNYQWYKGNSQLSATITTNLTLTNVSFASAGNYSVIASNSFGSATSQVATVTVFAENSRLLAYEGFAYPGGASPIDGSQNGGSGWSNAWQIVSGAGASINDGSLVGGANVPSGYDAISQGNSYYEYSDGRIGRWLDCSSTGTFAARGYLNSRNNVGAAGKTLYISFLLQPSLVSKFYEVEFHRGDLGDAGRKAGIGNDTATNQVFLRTPAGFTDLGVGDSSSGLDGLGNTVGNAAMDLYIVRIDFHGGNDDVRVYRNPTSMSEPGTPTATVINAGDMSFNAISIGSFFGNPVAVDEIRVGATWADALGTPVASLPAPIKQGGSWNVQVTATPDHIYRVQSAADILGPWTDIGTVTNGETGLGSFTDMSPDSAQKFYRAVTP